MKGLLPQGPLITDLPDAIVTEWHAEFAQRRELMRKNAELDEREITLKESRLPLIPASTV